MNETGLGQAEGLYEKLKDKNLEVIFSSPLIRAKHTAEISAERLNIPVLIKDDLRECFYGVAESQKIEDLKRDYPEIINNWYNPEYMDIRFEGGESKIEAMNRVLAVLESLLNEKYSVMGIAIHGGTMSTLLNYYGVTFSKLGNCAAFHLIYQDGKWFVEGEVF